jgi:hypothetical protein
VHLAVDVPRSRLRRQGLPALLVPVKRSERLLLLERGRSAAARSRRAVPGRLANERAAQPRLDVLRAAVHAVRAGRLRKGRALHGPQVHRHDRLRRHDGLVRHVLRRCHTLPPDKFGLSGGSARWRSACSPRRP